LAEFWNPTGSGRGRQPRHRAQRLPGQIGAVPVQSDQEVLAAQLRSGHPDQHLPGAEPTISGLIGPTAASSRSITPSRSASSVTATSPENRVSDSSAAPTRTRARCARLLRTLPTR
jgi:hypothetical protein